MNFLLKGFRLCVICILTTGSSWPIERWVLLETTDLIAVGSMSELIYVPRSSPMQFRGALRVNEVVALRNGVRLPSRTEEIPYTYICDCCSSLDPNVMRNEIAGLRGQFSRPSFWFLARNGAGGWVSAMGCENFGNRPLSWRAELGQVIRTHYSGTLNLNPTVAVRPIRRK